MLAALGEDLSLRSIVETLLDMRTYRMGLIQTEDQLRFSVDAIVQGVKNMGVELEEKKMVVNGKRMAEQEVSGVSSQAGAKKRKNSES